MAERRTWMPVSLVVAVLMLTGCSSVNETEVSERLTASASLSVFNGATVEVQHPGAPWVNKLVIRVFVDDESAEGVAAAVRQVAVFAAGDPALEGEELTVMAYPGSPEDYADGGLGVSYLPIMGSVSEITGGTGREGVLELSVADIQRLAAER